MRPRFAENSKLFLEPDSLENSLQVVIPRVFDHDFALLRVML